MSDQQAVAGTWLKTYEIQALVGRGGMASVFRAFDHNLQRQVAIKVLSALAASQPGFAERFRQEALLIARLHHPNIAQVYDYGEQDGLTFMVEELLPGPTLSEQLANAKARHTYLSREQVLKIVRDIANGLHAAHNVGIIHRDIKPDNAIWNARGDLVLTDFGIARMLAATDSHYTQTGTIIGTPSYMSPEQVHSETLTPASDVYSLGIVLYELLAGHVPFSGSTAIAVVMDHIQTPPPPLRPLRPDLPPAVEAVVMRALAKQSRDRFSSTLELADALTQAWSNPYATNAFDPPGVHQQPTQAWSPPQGNARPAPRSAVGGNGRRLGLLFGLIGVLALLMLCGAALAARSLLVGNGPMMVPTSRITVIATDTAPDSIAVAATLESTPTIAATATEAATATPEATPTITATPVPLGLTKPIVFTSLRTGNWDVCRINPDGSGFGDLTNNAAEDLSPDWSPDGSLIAFQSNRDGDEDIFVMNADGSEPRNLTKTKYNDRDPVWSPDGRLIAYYARPNGNWNIYVMNADGSNPHPITNDPSDEFLPAWSPDGQWIAFTANAQRNDEIHIIRPDGSDRRRITNNPASDKFPAWSPDSTQLAFASDRGGNFDIYAMNLDGSNLRNLTNTPAGEAQPTWSPDGLFIAFVTNRDGKSEVYTMNVDGSNQTNLTNDPDHDAEPVWAR